MTAGITTFRYNRETKAMDIIDLRTGKVLRAGIAPRDLQAARQEVEQNAVPVADEMEKRTRKNEWVRRERQKEAW